MDTPASFLQGLSIIDLGLGKPAALVTKFLAEAGATVHRIEPESGDPFYKRYPAYEIWHQNKDIEYLNEIDDILIAGQLANADICVLGGEEHPDLEWALNSTDLAKRFPRLIILEIEATLPLETEEPLPANEILAQARSGLCYEHYSDRPVLFGLSAPVYGAALNAILGLIAALIERETSNQGQIVSTSLVEGALDACRPDWFQAESPDIRFNTRVPKDSRMTIFKCKDGKYVHLMMGTPNAKQRFYDLLGINPEEVNDTLTDRGLPTGKGDPRMFWGDIDTFAKPIANIDSKEFIKMLQENDFPCVLVSEPGECWDLPQMQQNKLIQTDSEGCQFVGFPIKGL